MKKFNWLTALLLLFLLQIFKAPEAYAETYSAQSYNLNSAGWIVVCNPNDQWVQKKFKDLCRDKSVRKNIAKLTYNSSKTLYEKGFKNAFLVKLSPFDVENKNFPYSTYPDKKLKNSEYFVVRFEEKGFSDGDEGVLAEYYRFDARKGAFTVGSNANIVGINKVVIHELFHAFQNAEVSFILDFGWITEGTAAAIESFVPGKNNRKPRDWKFSIEDRTDDLEYQVAEFWLSIDSSLKYLPKLFEVLASTKDSVSNKNHGFFYIDHALEKLGLGGIKRNYINMIKDIVKKPEQEYPYCLERKMECPEGKCSLKKLVKNKPITTTCHNIELTKLGACKEKDLKVKFTGLPEDHLFFLDKEMYRPGEEKVGIPTQFKLFSSNTAFDRGYWEEVKDTLHPADIEISCGGIKINNLKIIKGLSSASNDNDLDNLDKIWKNAPKQDTQKTSQFSSFSHTETSSSKLAGMTGEQEMTTSFSYLDPEDEKLEGNGVKGIKVIMTHKARAEAEGEIDIGTMTGGLETTIEFETSNTAKLSLEWNCSGNMNFVDLDEVMTVPSYNYSVSLSGNIEDIEQKNISCIESHQLTKELPKGNFRLMVTTFGGPLIENSDNGITTSTPTGINFSLELTQ